MLQHRPAVRRARGTERYAELSTRPLHVLVFLLPLIVLFEVGSNLYLSDPAHNTVETIRAQSMLLIFFEGFGIVGRYLPAVTIVTVLLVWHALLRDSWRVRPTVIGGMVMESLVWTVPLVVVVKLVLLFGAPAHAAAQGVGEGGALAGLGRPALATISIGAGLYEELLFRMIGIALLHAILVDMVRMSQKWGTWLSVLIAAAAFAVYHDVTTPAGGVDVVKAVSLLVAGTFFGGLYLSRGFGIVVAVHTLYDLLVLIALRR